MLVVGLTGGIASGKSTVSRRLEEHHHIPIIDADKIAREVVEPGQAAYTKIVNYFQSKIPNLLLDDNHLNRAALGKWVFSNSEDLQVLNQITHPAVRYTIFKRVLFCYLRGYSMCVLDVPLLFEAGLDLFCGVTIAVLSEPSLQLERLLARNPQMSNGEAKSRINSQTTNEERIEKADFVLTNNGGLPFLYREIDELVRRIQPTVLRTVLEYIPPFGAISAAAIVLSRYEAFAQTQKMK
ncbi:CAB5 (YDR196C) [Zygosaccharomyces parabailii]|uniref:BN860_13542g1_1 n=1 Tax=Zygosaccharomyces bailii (strain CLIB 213 / ATCC 58445 / CBS 680 / BCRC 21525 / NBRC 1098 / NCYC 1416 / NRRL Y-2227) TaxID=1333698 RepID=A0A8J2T4J0_ZYGB2|nr:CAB5 (YDR196C) [Zygosaccharomyces parabailii]CDF87747.1 BN860_13542g1_1 [Zygosaccharomyces bailii CLIB 213]CDH09878.1 probable Dephospho-CoA kinase CAB5 [Zygosaccharomyces bailii ISA1307]SJM83498.1 probable Dephospho-CoA kinase CAB5 [Zygosaccharomyces bailii]